MGVNFPVGIFVDAMPFCSKDIPLLDLANETRTLRYFLANS